MNFEICTQQEAKFVVNQLNDYNLNCVPPTISQTWIPLDYILKNSSNEVIAGLLSGINYWGGLEIKILWVREDMRSQGFASKLLNHVEDKARAMNASLSVLDTFDFQAEEFYLKNGYTVFGKLENFPEGHHRTYLSKKLT